MGLGDWAKGLLGVSEADEFHPARLRSRGDVARDFNSLSDAIDQGWLAEGTQAALSGDAAAQRDALRRALPTLEAMAHLLSADFAQLATILGGEGLMYYREAIDNWLKAGHALLAGDWNSCKSSMRLASRRYNTAAKVIARASAK